MKKILSMILCVCLLLGAAAAEEEAGENTFLLKVWNRSGEEFSYLRFAFFAGGRQTGYVLSCPNEGEDFYRVPYSPGDPGEPEDLRIEVSGGISGLPAEEAILQAMAGNPAEEHPLMTLDLKPECGREYQLALMKDGDAWKMVPIGE